MTTRKAAIMRARRIRTPIARIPVGALRIRRFAGRRAAVRRFASRRAAMRRSFWFARRGRIAAALLAAGIVTAADAAALVYMLRSARRRAAPVVPAQASADPKVAESVVDDREPAAVAAAREEWRASQDWVETR